MYVNVWKYVRTYVYMYVCMYVCMHACMSLSLSLCVCMYVTACTHALTHKHACMCKYLHAHTRICMELKKNAMHVLFELTYCLQIGLRLHVYIYIHTCNEFVRISAWRPLEFKAQTIVHTHTHKTYSYMQRNVRKPESKAIRIVTENAASTTGIMYTTHTRIYAQIHKLQ